MKYHWQAAGLITAVLAMGAFWALAAGVPRALAACGGGDDGFAEFYGPYAQTIVLGRYEKLEAAPTPAAPPLRGRCQQYRCGKQPPASPPDLRH